MVEGMCLATHDGVAMRILSLMLWLLFAGCGGSTVGSPDPAPLPVSEGTVPDGLFAGAFTFDGGEGERNQVAQSVDRATEDMNLIARGIARSRLKETNRAPETIELTRDGDRLTVFIDARRYEGALDAAPVIVTGITGDEVAMTFRVAGGQLLQTFRGEDGGRENAFTLVDANTVALDVRVFSPRLPADVVYTLTYRRPPSSEEAP